MASHKRLSTGLLVSNGGYVGMCGIKLPKMVVVTGILPPDGEHGRGIAYVSAHTMLALGFSVGEDDDDYGFFYTDSKTQSAEIKLCYPESYYGRYQHGE